MENIYRFEIPIEVSYCFDESNLSIESIDDIKSLEETYDVDLSFVIDEYEYKIEVEEQNINDDEEYEGLSKSEILDSVVTELVDEIVEQLNTSIKLFDIEDKIIDKIFKITSENFNNSKLQQYYTKKQDFNIISMIMINFDKERSVFYVDVLVDKDLNDIQIDEITKFIDGQCSDGWGEGFEQQDISHEINETNRYVYINTWGNQTEVKYVK